MAAYDATTKDGKCVFCEIVAGDIASRTFWEDEDHMAFLAIDPNTEGFSVVIPKAHYGSDVLRMPDEQLRDFIIAAKQVARVLEKHFDDVGRVGLMMEGTGIDHAHIKLVPFHGTEHLARGEWQQHLSDQEFWFDTYEGWMSSGSGPMADPEELSALADALRRSQ